MNKLSTFYWGTQGVHKYDSTHQTNLLEPLLCFKVKDFHFPFLLSLPKMSLAMTNFTTTTKWIWWWNQFFFKKGKGWKCWKMCRKFWQSLLSFSFQNPHQRKVDQTTKHPFMQAIWGYIWKSTTEKMRKMTEVKEETSCRTFAKIRSRQPLSLHSRVDTLWENMKGLCRTRW